MLARPNKVRNKLAQNTFIIVEYFKTVLSSKYL